MCRTGAENERELIKKKKQEIYVVFDWELELERVRQIQLCYRCPLFVNKFKPRYTDQRLF